jgi:hypothetical protein
MMKTVKKYVNFYVKEWKIDSKITNICYLKIKRLIKELGIEIQYMEFSGNGYFGIEENNTAIIFINEQFKRNRYITYFIT